MQKSRRHDRQPEFIQNKSSSNRADTMSLCDTKKEGRENVMLLLRVQQQPHRSLNARDT
jgi:hypothetical protein